MRKITSQALLAAGLLLLAACSRTPEPAATPDGGLPPLETVQVTSPPSSALPSVAGTATGVPDAVTPQEATSPATTEAAAVPNTGCSPTPPDALGPFYVPGAPERDQVGEGYVLSGVVRSADGCAPIPGAQIEIWMAGPDGNYGDDYRATLFSDENGAYRFESHFPPPYSGRPPHHHLRVSVQGFQTLVTQNYPLPNQTEAELDLVLLPE